MKSIRQHALIIGGIVGAACAAGAGVAATHPLSFPALSGTAAARPDDAADYQKLIDDYAGTIVTVKFVLKIDGGGGEGDHETETVGVMIDAKGIVLCSSIKTGGFAGMMGGGGPTVTPTDVKVLVGDDTEGKKATMLTRDSELDLAWIKIDEPGDKPYKHVDLSGAVVASIGQRVFAVDRMGKFFDRATVISEGRIRGITEKPRRLFVPTDALVSDLGLPVFTVDGKIVGVTIVQFPDPESVGTGGGADGQGARAMVLPADEVAKATKRAMENPTPAPAPASDKAKEGDKPGAPRPAAPKADKP
jgi:hypothetical protein